MKEALADAAFSVRRGKGRVVVAAVGKAAWRMARAAADFLGPDLSGGAVITKYGHSMGPIDGLEIFEAGAARGAVRGSNVARELRQS